MSNIKIIFILPNIYESVNGVSTKYLKFIDYISNKSHNIVLLTTFKNKENYDNLIKNNNVNVIKTNGLVIPFYKDIKIPIIDYNKIKEHITEGNEIIVFNGEFIWLYEILKKIKKHHKTVKIYPTMHTDYIYYGENIYKNYSFGLPCGLNHLNHFLETKIFNGIIVTGKLLYDKYIEITENVFNANEVNLEIFNNVKKDEYEVNFYNIIFCGRISKEKNIEELFDCCSLLDSYNFTLHIIGDGPYLPNLKDIIELEYKKIKSKIVFHGNKEPEEINNLYQTLDNRIFLFSSVSETFGKTPMEAGATGIPIFIKKSDISEILYTHKKNGYIFEESKDFLDLFEYFIKLSVIEKQMFIYNSVSNIKKYDQSIIFENWLQFLLTGMVNKNKNKLNLFDIFTFHGISNFISCSGNLLGD